MSRAVSLPWRDQTASSALVGSGRSDPGIQRNVNEDRFYCHAGRGLFVVIDGVGGQAAGGKAADVALALLRERLERETGPVAERIREGITIANNEIHRLASTRTEWEGMACVLTVAVVQDGTATFGHVGDTRLYKLQHDRIEKLTRDHSPVGEREDARELSELQAMKHPRRNEVYRDVGSELHDAADRDFIDVGEVPFEEDAALLLCSDGLTDLVDSAAIARTVRRHAGDAEAVTRALVDESNAAGGKDNITVVYVEGERFAASQSARAAAPGGPTALAGAHRAADARARDDAARRIPSGVGVMAIATMLIAVVGIVVFHTAGADLGAWFGRPATPAGSVASRLSVSPTGSIAAALRDAQPGSEIVVEPGEYREQLMLKADVRLISRIPRGARLRLPAAVRDAADIPAIIARDIAGAELVGFTVSGDAATPLAIGILVANSAVSLVDVEITGASTAAVEFSWGGASTLIGSDIRDNPGAALVVRDGATPRISHNTFVRNGTSERAPAALLVEPGSAPTFSANVFATTNPDSYAAGLDGVAYAALRRENWFVSLTTPPRSRADGPGRPSVRR